MSDDLKVQPGEQITLESVGSLPKSAHVFDEDAILAIRAAMASRRPLLIRGEPGTGKTQLAHAAAEKMGRLFIPKTVDAQTEARDLLWSFDAIERLAEAQVLGAAGAKVDEIRKELARKNFVVPGPLWWAFDWKEASDVSRGCEVPPPPHDDWKQDDGCVVLIDEIDKADASVPNGLLEALGSGSFDAPGYRVEQKSKSKLLTIVTTNEERALPDAFLRRCLVLQLRLPTNPDRLKAWLIARARAHHGDSVDEEILGLAADQLIRDRSAVRERGLSPPGQAEYLDLIRALDDLEKGNPDEQKKLLKQIATFALEKHPRDSRDEDETA
ncbi:MAG: MoxR family ATPase [Planctomycetota bacterium]